MQLFSLTARNCSLLLLPLLITTYASAQGLFTPTLSRSWQATFTNPALYTNMEQRITVGLPGVTDRLDLDGITYDEIVVEKDGVEVLELNTLVGLLDERNSLRNDLDVETLGVGFNFGKIGLGVSHRFRSKSDLNYPRALVDVIANGNAQYLGQVVGIAPYLQATNYHEFALGMSFKASETVHIGGRIKYLSGVADIRIDEDQTLALETDENTFALTLRQNMVINSTNAITYGGFDDANVDFVVDDLSLDELFGPNAGIAADLGVFVDLGDLRLQAAALDLGASINWDQNANNLIFFGDARFDGLDVLADVFTEGFSLENALDSLEAVFEPTESFDAYQGKIGGRYLAAGEYDLTQRWTLAASVEFNDRVLENQVGAAAGARYRLLEALSVGAHYNVRGSDVSNLGLQAYGSLGPVRLLISTDDVLTLFRPRRSAGFGFRVGAALVLGEQMGADAD